MTHRFDLTSGATALNFINTMDKRGPDGTVNPSDEFLKYPTDLADFLEQSHLLADKDVARELYSNDAEGRLLLLEAMKLREALYGMFLATVHKSHPQLGEISVVNDFLTRLGPLALDWARQGGAHWKYSPPKLIADRLLYPIVMNACEILVSETKSKLRICAAESCGWIFMDNTKNGKRRWCNMADCGNRAKAKRFYAKSKKD